jgi:cold shock CspA family protein
MSQVGQVLTYVPADPSGLWIHKTVAASLDRKDAEQMRSGFTMKLFNRRGGFGFTAGREEMKIAEGYRRKAEAVENSGFPRLAGSLRELAKSYEQDAERDAAGGAFDE